VHIIYRTMRLEPIHDIGGRIEIAVLCPTRETIAPSSRLGHFFMDCLFTNFVICLHICFSSLLIMALVLYILFDAIPAINIWLRGVLDDTSAQFFLVTNTRQELLHPCSNRSLISVNDRIAIGFSECVRVHTRAFPVTEDRSIPERARLHRHDISLAM
jgi:hypothetical protein